MVFAEQAEVVNKHIQGFVERVILWTIIVD
jgi:hypothetical protein